jgi:rare lipoprotein A
MMAWLFRGLMVLGLGCLMIAAVIAFVPRAHAGMGPSHHFAHPSNMVGLDTHPMRQCGIASWYSYTGRRGADGSIYTGRSMTAAHRSLAFGTRVRVTDTDTGRSIIVTITDRGPYISGRIIDLSPVARRALGMGGLAKVCLTPG